MIREIAIEARALTKEFDGQNVLKNLDFKIEKGECYGFLGVRGAGKSTLTRLLSCVSPITKGALFVNGLNSQEHRSQVKAKVGVVSQLSVLDEDFSVLDNLLVYGKLHGMRRQALHENAHSLLRRFRIEEFSSQPISVLSQYQTRQLELARALIHDPEILILDEPLEGLNRSESAQLFSEVHRLKREDLTIVLATTSIDEIEEVCDRVALLDQGQMLVEGQPSELVAEIAGYEVVEFLCPSRDLDYYLSRLSGNYDFQVSNNSVRIFMGEGQESRSVLNYINSERLTIRRSDLGDAFFKVVGREL